MKRGPAQGFEPPSAASFSQVAKIQLKRLFRIKLPANTPGVARTKKNIWSSWGKAQVDISPEGQEGRNIKPEDFGDDELMQLFDPQQVFSYYVSRLLLSCKMF